MQESVARETEQRQKVDQHFDKLTAALQHRSVSFNCMLSSSGSCCVGVRNSGRLGTKICLKV